MTATTDEVGAKLEEKGIDVRCPEDKAEEALPLLAQLAENETVPQSLIDQLAELGITVTGADVAELADDDEEETPPADQEDAPEPDPEAEDFEEPPLIGGDLFQFGPLAAGIQMFEAVLNEAKAGYVAQRISELEAALRTNFSEEDKIAIAEFASSVRDEMGLPDVSGAYQALVSNG